MKIIASETFGFQDDVIINLVPEKDDFIPNIMDFKIFLNLYRFNFIDRYLLIIKTKWWT